MELDQMISEGLNNQNFGGGDLDDFERRDKSPGRNKYTKIVDKSLNEAQKFNPNINKTELGTVQEN